MFTVKHFCILKFCFTVKKFTDEIPLTLTRFLNKAKTKRNRLLYLAEIAKYVQNK